MRLFAVLVVAVLMTSAAALLFRSPYTYAVQDRINLAATASRSHPAGTDELGRDIAVRVAAALLLGLAGACAASVLASSLSLALGGLAALGPSWCGRGLLYLGDLFLTLPWIFLLMLVRAALPLSLPPVQSGVITFLLLAALGAPTFLRLTHERTSSLLRTDWFLQAHSAGLRPAQIGRQMLPHLLPVFWTQFLLYVPACLIAEANLGALGLGMSEPIPSWGNMLAGLQSAVMISSSHLVYLPMLVLVLMLVSLELMIFGAKS